MHVTLAPVSMCIAAALRTGVRVHIVTGNNVHANIRGRTTNIVPLAARHGHRRLAAAIVKQIYVSIAKMPIRDAIDDVVKARFAQSNPGGGVKNAIRYRCRRMVCEHNAKRQPERDKDEKTVEVGTRQRQIPRVR